VVGTRHGKNFDLVTKLTDAVVGTRHGKNFDLVTKLTDAVSLQCCVAPD